MRSIWWPATEGVANQDAGPGALDADQPVGFDPVKSGHPGTFDGGPGNRTERGIEFPNRPPHGPSGSASAPSFSPPLGIAMMFTSVWKRRPCCVL